MRIFNRSLLAGICLTYILMAGSRAQEHHPEHSWDYGDALGPSHWGEIKPDFATCKNGLRQSPIDIRNPQRAELPPIRFDYKSSPLHIINNGHTIQINYAPGSYIVIGEKRYELRQFHFHHPSEEHINGEAYDMVVHLVHADEGSHLAVIAVLLKKGNANTAIQKLWDNLPRTEGKEESVQGVEVNAAFLLPKTLGYYTFEGSLTTPPCSESVTWYVLKSPVEVSAVELAAFSKLYAHNSRPVQPLNGRVVLESK